MIYNKNYNDAIYGNLPKFVTPKGATPITKLTYNYSYTEGNSLSDPTIVPGLGLYVEFNTERYFIGNISFIGDSNAVSTLNISADIPVYVGMDIVCRDFYTGAFFAVKKITTKTVNSKTVPFLSVTPYDLLDPNELGTPPEPTATKLIPTDTPHIIVGWGHTKVENKPNPIFYHISQLQYWRRGNSSFTLGPKQNKIVVLDQVTGMTDTSSSRDSISKMLGVSASAGWGPISASISASLNATSSRSHTRTINEQTTISIEDEIKNPNDYPMTYIHWELVDLYSWCDTSKALSPLASVESVQAPPLLKIYSHNSKSSGTNALLTRKKSSKK